MSEWRGARGGLSGSGVGKGAAASQAGRKAGTSAQDETGCAGWQAASEPPARLESTSSSAAASSS
jgi:hypothetical protein